MDTFKLFDVIALTEDIPEYHLRRGQVGTVVEIFDEGKAFEIEFADQSGRTYECVGIEPAKMMLLQYGPDSIAA